MMRAALLLALFASPLACSSEGDASAQCHDLIDLYCARLVGCESITMADCESQVETQIPCAKAVSVTNTYNACESEISSAACSSLEQALPADCNGTIQVGN